MSMGNTGKEQPAAERNDGSAGGELSFGLAFRLAVRELRTGKRGLTVFIGCLFLGVLAIAAVGSVSETSRASLARDARVLLGGDALVRLASTDLTENEQVWLERYGSLARSTTLRAMVRAENGNRLLVELKGVGSNWPLYGTATFSDEYTRASVFAAQQAKPVVAVEPVLLNRLGIAVGDAVEIGRQSFIVAATITNEPDRVLQGITFGPRVLMSMEGLQATQLLLPGSLIRRNIHIRLYEQPLQQAERESINAPEEGARSIQQHGIPDIEAVKRFVTEARVAFPDAGWRIRRFDEAAPRIRQLLDRLDVNLMLIGLGALLVGGLGIAEAVRGYLDSRLASIASMKCVGGTSATVFMIYLLQVVLMGSVAIVLACLTGAGVPLLAADLLEKVLPVAVEKRVHWGALGRAATFGVAVILAFSLPALLRAVTISPVVLFRGYIGNAPGSYGAKGHIAVYTLFGVLAAVTVLFTEDMTLAAGFILGTICCYLVFRLVAAGIRLCAQALSGYGPPAVRLGMAALHRPGAPTKHLTFALGLGLTALVAIAQIESTLTGSVERDLAKDAPAYFFINVLTDQQSDFAALAERDGISRVDSSPMVRGRIVRIAGVPVNDVEVSPDVRWAVRGDRGLSHAAAMPEGSSIVSGEWWPEQYSGPPLISLTADLAEGFGVEVGDTLTLNILGREITATIANTREVDWMTFQLQFAIIFAPGILEQAPVTWVSTVYGQEQATDAVYREVTERFANVTALGMREILSNVQDMMQRAGDVFRGMATVMLATGFLVLAGAVMADRRRRLYDAVVYKVCGATTADVVRALATEFAIAGTATGCFAALTGTAVAWVATEGLLDLAFTPDIPTLLGTILAGGGFALLFGMAGTVQALRKKPAPYLRNE